MRVAHIYASNAKINSGDYMLGIATKHYFKNIICEGKDVTFKDYDCRNPELYTGEALNNLNKFDMILIGGGGLILPDSSPNKTSCWQWWISYENMQKLVPPMHVVSIGCNLFNGQTMEMANRDNSACDVSRIPIFKKSITSLINKATQFSMRHNGDIEKLLEIIGDEYRGKITFQKCPCIDYVKEVWKPSIHMDNRKYIAFEIKDDREWRRYHKIKREPYYHKLLIMVKKLLDENKDVCYLSHDGSINFNNFLKSNGVHLPVLQCNTGNEQDILKKYAQVHTIFCSAGHSQMFSYGLGIRTISLISHPKLQYFCEDFPELLDDAIDVNNNIDKIFQIEI